MSTYNPITQPIDCLAVSLYHKESADKWKKPYALPIFFYDLVNTPKSALCTLYNTGKYTVKLLTCGTLFHGASASSILRSASKTFHFFLSTFYSPMVCLFKPEFALKYHVRHNLHFPEIFEKAQTNNIERFRIINELLLKQRQIQKNLNKKNLPKKIEVLKAFNKEVEKGNDKMLQIKPFFEIYSKLPYGKYIEDNLASLKSIEEILEFQITPLEEELRRVNVEVTRRQLRRESIYQRFKKDDIEKLEEHKKELLEGEKYLSEVQDIVPHKIKYPKLIEEIEKRIEKLQTPPPPRKKTEPIESSPPPVEEAAPQDNRSWLSWVGF